ncbi:MAG TPA: circadian clock KaiB family protein [Candidatus Xenobia bacterium]
MSTPLRYSFRLFIAAGSVNSTAALGNLPRLFQNLPQDCYEIHIIDVNKQPEEAAAARILAIPTLVKDHPAPVRWIIGDLSDAHRVAIELEVDLGNGA